LEYDYGYRANSEGLRLIGKPVGDRALKSSAFRWEWGEGDVRTKAVVASFHDGPAFG
jgi:hypothetical protein